jgi:hypothetical protein
VGLEGRFQNGILVAPPCMYKGMRKQGEFPKWEAQCFNFKSGELIPCFGVVWVIAGGFGRWSQDHFEGTE